jgi:putative acetyltransferase
MERLNAHNLSHCPPEICHLATAEQLAESDCLMIGAFTDEHLCGMGALKFFENYGEITRMFVEQPFRRKGIARQILDLLIQEAVKRNLESLKLETSEQFANAVRLYKSSGFVPCAPFGEYVHAPHNAYLEKTLRVL